MWENNDRMVALPAKPTSHEQGSDAQLNIIEKKLVVSQPEQLKDILSEIEHITEDINESAQEDIKSQGTKHGRGGQKSNGTMTNRKSALAALPSSKKMESELKRHIQKEIRTLRREARRIIRLSKPGSAYQLNMIYARIRRLNALLSNLFQASVEVLKRFFIRIFVDNQSIL
jgi:hypothetical protein